jgi:hypothetical protein
MQVSLNSMRRERKVIERRIEWHRRLIRETTLVRRSSVRR